MALTPPQNQQEMQNEIRLRPGRPSDAPQIATLIMQAMSEECCRYFHGDEHTPEDFHRLIASLAEREDTQYSYTNAICAVTPDDRLAGVSVSYDGGKLRQLRQPFIDGARQAFGRDFSSMAEETQAGELYLDSIAVMPEHRGKGIAKTLLEATAEKARKSGAGPLGLLVDNGNPNAERLYIKVGFRQVGINNWGGHEMKHMQLA